MANKAPGRRVYVGDLLANVRKDELEKEFQRFGKLMDVWVAHNPPGFAFLEFSTTREAERAVRAMDGKHVCGSKVRVELSKNTGPKPRPAGRGGKPPPRGRSPRRSPPRRRLTPPPIPRRQLSPPPRRALTPPRNLRDGPPRYEEFDPRYGGYDPRYSSRDIDMTRYRDDTRYRELYTSAAPWDRRSPPGGYRSRSPVARRRYPAGSPQLQPPPPPRGARDFGREYPPARGDYSRERNTRDMRDERPGYRNRSPRYR